MKLAALALAVSLTAVASAVGAPGVDQSQLETGTGVSRLGSGSDSRLAQTLLPAVAGFLTEVRVAVTCDGESGVHLEVSPVWVDYAPPASGYPSFAPPVAAADAAAPAAAEDTGTLYPIRSFALPQRPFFPAGKAIAFALSSPGRCAAPSSPLGDLYTRGHAFWTGLPNPPARWYLLSAIGGHGDDLVFATVTEPACQVPAVVKLPPANASAAIADYGCAQGAVSSAYSASVPRGRVVSTTPSAGKQLPAGAAVRIVVSKGPKPRRGS